LLEKIIQSCQDELDSVLKETRKMHEFSDDDDDDWSQENKFSKKEHNVKDEDDDDESEEETVYPDFKEFDKKILDALELFDNKAFIKLNWSSPKDAYWSLNKLKCERLSDVYILLKSSDFISHDLNEPFIDCEDYDANVDPSIYWKKINYNLIIRDWISFNSNMEFRCFVHENVLMGK
jgi:hypothetical protein